MTEFSDALNKQNRAEMAALSGAEAADKPKAHHDGRIEALEKRVAALEAKLADSRWLWENAAGALGTLPPAPAANTDPTA